MLIVPPIDYIGKPKLKVLSHLKYINLGFITEVSYYKGENLLEKLFTITENKNYEVSFYIYGKYYVENNIKNVYVKGSYNENDIYQKLIDDKIHGLIFLNNYPETYSYAFTKGINTGLPLFFSNKGALKGG